MKRNNNQKKVVVCGAGGHAGVIVDILESEGCSEILYLLDDRKELWEKTKHGYQVRGGLDRLEWIYNEKATGIIIGIGKNSTRRRIAEKLPSLGIKALNAVHPSAVLSPKSHLDDGTVVMAGAIINSDTTVGIHSIVNTRACLEHDCKVGRYVHISPGALLGGGVTVDDEAHIGMGAMILPGRRIGSGTVVGAGAVVLEDLPRRVIAVGSPARVIKRL